MSGDERVLLRTRVGDRLNPILIREVHQALNGRGFLITAGLALLTIIVIALVVAATEDVAPGDGAIFFLSTLMALFPIIFFIVPFQVFLSMRAEVGGGTIEHLLMSRLSPGAIVRGKLIAATVQFGIYLAIFSPLLAMTFLLRGIDVPTIAMMLTLAFVVALGCSALAVACGALCRWKSLFRVIPFGIVLLGLGWLVIVSMAGLGYVVREAQVALANEQALHWMGTYVLPILVGVVLCALTGASALAHPYANRSSAFRIFALLGLSFILWSTVHSYFHASALSLGPYDHLGETLSHAVTLAAVLLCLFPFFAATEAPRLTPRVAQHVPRNPLLAFLSTPFLPGAGRGMLFATVFSILPLAALYGLPILWDDTPADAERWRVSIACWLYVLIFCGIAAGVRSLLGPQANKNWYARGVMPILFFLGVILPLIQRAVASAGETHHWARWSGLDVLNPFDTVSRLRRSGTEAELIMTWLLAIAVPVVLLNVVPMVRGLTEVQRAAKARREHAG